jgi:peptidoglycan/xylan/chitin deacetylase (PgdA/CDA1 family)
VSRIIILSFLLLGFLAGGLLAWGMSHPNWMEAIVGRSISILPSREAAKTARFAQPQERLHPENDRPPFEIHPLARLSTVPAIMYHDVVGTYKQVWFDTTTAELRQHFEAIRAAGVTPVSMDQLYHHLRDGEPLPEKAILLTFDDAYLGQYENAYPLLKEFNYPAVYFVQTGFVGVPTSKDHFTWEQMQEMDRENLVSFAAHTISHPEDLRLFDDAKLRREIGESKRVMEEKLGHPIDYFAYPAGNRDERVKQYVADAGFKLSFTMDTGFTGQSPNLLEVRRFNQFRLTEAIVGARTVLTQGLPTYDLTVDRPLQVKEEILDRVRTLTIRGGRPATVHAEQRYNVSTLLQRYQATAGINGSFFSIPWINSASNIMVGPVMAANTKTFIPGRPEDNQAIRGRPLVLFGEDRISFLPFDPDTMNSLETIQQLMPDVTDLFVGGLWLVKDGKPLSGAELESFRLSSAWEYRPRAFFGIDQRGQVVAGTTDTHINAKILAQILPQTGVKEAILLDSGFSTSLVYEDQILATGHSTDANPSRPVPHVILLYDLPKLWSQSEVSADTATPSPSGVDRLVGLVPQALQPDTKAVLQSVLSGELILQRGNRGAAIMAIQMGLMQIANSQGRSDLLPSGPDGVYGQEIGLALAELGFASLPAPPTVPSPLSTATPLLPVQPTPWAGISPSATIGISPLPVQHDPVNVIDARLLQSLLDHVKSAPPAVLVKTVVPHKPADFSKPVAKLIRNQPPEPEQS